MKTDVSRQRRRLWQLWQTAERLARQMHRSEPICPGSLYLLRRRCGKPACRCRHGHPHATWVLTRSEQGRVRLYPVREEDRPEVRRLTDAYRIWQRARAALIKVMHELVRHLDEMADQRLRSWPRPGAREATDEPTDHRTSSPAGARGAQARRVRRSADRGRSR